MTTDDYDYNLPEELIKQTPLVKRDESRLFVLDKKTKTYHHKKFYDVIDYLEEGDTLVLNNTKVLPARLIGVKEDTNAIIEILLLKEKEENCWECLTKPAKRVKIDTVISFGDGKLKAKCISEGEEGIRKYQFIYDGILLETLEELGTMPLPPYIHEQLNDQSYYQTVYAKEVGSAAAPTAGLHFTEELLNKIADKKVNIAYITLHVGLGTFRPVAVENIENHKMHSEFYIMDSKTADLLNKTKENGKKIVAVGTTTVRTLETIMKDNDKFIETTGETDIFIYPGFEFKAVDTIITNFHLPKSTLLMLISAFASTDIILKAYEEAIKEKYYFFSFGDAMIIK